MNVTYHVTLVQLSVDAAMLEPVHGTPHDLGELAPADLGKLLVNFSRLDVSSLIDAAPAMVIRRHGRGWRITPGNKTLIFHDGLDSLAPSFPLTPDGILAAIAPDPTDIPAEESSAPAAAGRPQRRLNLTRPQALCLLVAGLVLLAAGVWFGLHEEDINALPGDVVEVTAPAEANALFAAAQGQYLTSVSPGNGVLTLGPTGHFSFATMGPDGLPLPVTHEEQGRAGRRAGRPCVITSVGLVEIVDRDTLHYNDIVWHRHAAPK